MSTALERDQRALITNNDARNTRRKTEFQCHLCQKLLSTERGRSLCLNYCRRKHAGNSQLSQGESSAATGTTIFISHESVANPNDPNFSSQSPQIWGTHTKG